MYETQHTNVPAAFRVVTGGQTGVDRAALDAALASGVSVGGWCPRGRRAEDGVIDVRYPLQETPSPAYVQRTVWNVRDSDGTLVLTLAAPVGGTAVTIEEARRQMKPLLHVHLDQTPGVGAVERWLEAHAIRVLNVAGPRASEAPGIYEAALGFLRHLFEQLQSKLH